MSLVRLLEEVYSPQSPAAALCVEGVLSESELIDTARSIVEAQRESGIIPWFENGHCDPWNLVETAMALDIAGFADNAFDVYMWLQRNQHDDGSWHQYYLADSSDPAWTASVGKANPRDSHRAVGCVSAQIGDRMADGFVKPLVEDAKFDANTICYVATGLWCRYLIRGDIDELRYFWPMVRNAVDWVVELQRDSGDIIWARHPDGSPFDFSLLTGSSSIYDSLRAAISIAEALNIEESHERAVSWKRARQILGDCILNRRHVFEPKDRWAMDWYYPVLGGCVTGVDAKAVLDRGYRTFVIEDMGVRCVSDQNWVTSAETSEASLAYLAAGHYERALELFEMAQVNRHSSGAYHTGYACDHNVYYPAGEHSTYTAAAIIICARILASWQTRN